jgi:serine/threonine protein kinase
MMYLIDNGIDEVITDEPDGLNLALEIRNRVLVQSSLVQKFNEERGPPEEGDKRKERAAFLEEVMHDSVWDYLRVRLASNVPEIDWSLPPGIPHQIEDYQLGMMLGKGNFGSVYKLEYSNREPTGCVIKACSKRRKNDMASLYNAKRQLEVMEILSLDFPHPNVAKVYNVYHSETHLFFELEDCGPLDLYRCYLDCAQRRCPLSLSKTRAIKDQMISAVCHMHVKANVVHCDLKPENIIISHSENNALIKISDFDTAQASPRIPQYDVVGTFPFSAPEIILEKQYDPYAADIWSLGLVLMELLCYSEVLERALQLDSGKDAKTRGEKAQIRREMMRKIYGYFSHEEAVSCLLQENMRHDLHDLLSRSFLSDLRAMLNVSSAMRIRAGALIRAA